MPYIAADTVKIIRTKLKKELPNVKLSVTGQHYSTLVVCVMESDIDFGVGEYAQLNEFYIEKNFQDRPAAQELLLKIMALIEASHEQKEVTYDYDYGSVPNYYISLNVGKWDKPYVLRGAK